MSTLAKTRGSLLVHRTSRSQILTGQRCPRREWWEYDQPNRTPCSGIQPDKADIDLLIGIGFHKGMELLLLGTEIDETIEIVLNGGENWKGIWPILKSTGLALKDNENILFTYQEVVSMVEALIRGYEKCGLQQLLDRFYVVEVEAEEFTRFEQDDFSLIFGFRTDGLLMEKESSDLYILSYKTAREYGKKQTDSGFGDMQGLSETVGVERRLQKWQEQYDNCPVPGARQFAEEEYKIPTWFLDRADAGFAPVITGVKMEYAIKGRRSEYPGGSGIWRYNNVLIHPWTRGKSQYALNWKWSDPMGNGHTLGKGWHGCNIWEDMSIKEWIDYLWSEEIQENEPGTGVAKQFAFPDEFFRNPRDMERWEFRTIAAGRRKQIGIDIVLASIGTPEFEDRLDEEFPPHSDSCHYPKDCPFIPICYGPPGAIYEPMSMGSYVPRVPNHQASEEEA